MKKKNSAALIYGNNLHYLDHLAPLSSLLNIDLITNEENIFELTKKYYPNTTPLYKDYLEFNFFLVKEYDYIFSCFTRPFFDADFSFHQDLFKKNVHTIWCPHGNSDKGHSIFFMEALQTEKTILIYGKKMMDYIKEKKTFKTNTNYFSVGNYRHKYFLQNKEFYNNIVNNEIKSKLPDYNKTIFYAPTWDDSENSSSFWSSYQILIDNLPDNFNLIIKIHPNMSQQNDILLEQIIYSYENKKNILFLKVFPPIYPLIDFSDVYLGDASSIGYDFITFNKPMFFLKTKNKTTFLNQCGYLLSVNKNIYNEISLLIKKNSQAFSNVRKKISSYTFDNVLLNKGLLNEICSG